MIKVSDYIIKYLNNKNEFNEKHFYDIDFSY